MTDAELSGLLIDCLTLWDIRGNVAIGETGMEVSTMDGLFVVQCAPGDCIRYAGCYKRRHAARRIGRRARRPRSVRC